MQSNKHVIIIGGATASGKSSLALALAQEFELEIFSCDSRQFYREMSIGTAKPSSDELDLVKHHFINSLSIHDSYDIGKFETDALSQLDIYFKNRDIALLVGGSGLYIKALCEGIDQFPEVSPNLMDAIRDDYEQNGLISLQEQLQALDPVHFEKIDQHNPHRLMRALGICKQTGQPYSSFLGKKKDTRPFKCHYFWLDWPRETLYKRINQRVDDMMTQGLLDEVKNLQEHKSLKSLQTVGYTELFKYLNQESSLEDAVALIKQNSRRYAKRQYTWMRKYGQWQIIPQDQTKIVREKIKQLRQ